MINCSQTRREEYISGVKAWEDFVKAFIDVFDRAFEVCLLFVCEVRSRKLVGRLVLGMSQI